MGASKSLDIVDSFALIPAEKAGKYYYIPNIEAANRQIHQWAKEEICFCGCNLVRRTEKGRLRRRGWGLRWEKAQKGGKGTNLRGFFED